MNRSKSLAAALFACLPLIAHGDPGWYIGFDAGKTQADAEFKDFLLIGDSSDEDSASSTGIQLRGGYQFGRFFALELGVLDLGDFEHSFDPEDCPIFAGDSCQFTGSTSFRGFTLSMVGILPLGEHWPLRARAGMSQMHAKSRQLNGVVSTSDSTDQSGAQFGLGVGFKIDDHWQFLLNHTRIDALDFGLGSSSAFGVYDVGDTSMTSVGINYHW